jgi:asparagine N-glycosylation enzyme membrane subunit Stt3
MWCIQTLLLHLIVLLFFAIALKTKNKVFMFLSGVVTAFCLIGYAGAIVIIPVIGLFFM